MDFKAIYFVGAGGIGMSALVRYFLAQGILVGGYDRTASTLTETLIQEGAHIHYTDDITSVPDCYKKPDDTLVVFTPAIPSTHGELTYFRTHGFRVMKRAQLLGLITQSSRGLCVAGTHGKTTTSSMLAHILKQSHVDCNAFLGGILKPYNSNLMLSDHSDLTVIEADEFDRSFHTLSPYMAVITSCDVDHLDIYGTEAAYRDSFAHFTSLIQSGGVLLRHKDIQVENRLQDGVRCFEYGVNVATLGELPNTAPFADFYADHLRIGNGTILFDFVISPQVCSNHPEGLVISDLEVGVPVPINVDNAVAALAIAWLNGCTETEMRAAIKTYGGARRRFDFYLKTPHLVLLDDYAHHPDEIKASLSSVRQLFAGRHLTVVFQPHLFSRTQDLADEFATALAIPDRTILLPIYPAREQPIPGITSGWLLQKINSADKCLIEKSDLINHLRHLQDNAPLDVIVMMGAGDIEHLVPSVAEALKH